MTATEAPAMAAGEDRLEEPTLAADPALDPLPAPLQSPPMDRVQLPLAGIVAEADGVALDDPVAVLVWLGDRVWDGDCERGVRVALAVRACVAERE